MSKTNIGYSREEGKCSDDIDTDNHVKLHEINQNNCENLSNRHVVVKVVWRSDKPPPNSNQPCRFMLSDETGHVGAVLFLKENIHTSNVYNKLKPNSKILKLKNFSVQEVKENYRIIKSQSKQLKLSQSTLDLKEMCVDSTSDCYPNYLPIQNISLENVDDVSKGEFVDVIGHAKYISKQLTSKKNQQLQYQKVIMSTHSSFSPEAEDVQFLRYLALFDKHIGTIKVGTTYILQNVKVDYFEYDNSKSLKTTALTIAHEIINIEGMRILLPPNYQSLSQIENLFSSKNSSREILPISASSNAIAVSQKRPLSPYLSDQTVFRKLRKLEPVGSQCSTGLENRDACTEDDYKDFPEVSYDFINNETPLVVKVLSAKCFKGTRNKAYTMRSKTRGIALIINNYFPNEAEKARKGSHFDMTYLDQCLRSCNFEIFIKNEVSSKELPTILTNFKAKATNAIDCCFVAVLSHGCYGGVEMADGEYVHLHTDIIYQFDDFNFTIFKDKPKVFVIQACQEMPMLESLRNSRTQFKFSLDNTIVCYATIPEFSAERDIYLGSPFIYVFAHTFMHHAHDRHLKDILDQVHERLKKVQRSEDGPLNCCYTIYGFKKKLYFNPGL